MNTSGSWAQACLLQSGGTNTVSGALGLASQAGATGSYTLSGGTLAVGTQVAGGAGTSTLTINGGQRYSVGGGAASIQWCRPSFPTWVVRGCRAALPRAAARL